MVQNPVITQVVLETLPKRFINKMAYGEDGCWVWTASLNTKGYGNYWTDGTCVGAHRYAYETIVGPVPEGLQLDHLCRNRNCVNPEHLEPVTCRENLLRGETIAASHAQRSHCKHGHELDDYNTYVYPKTGKRACRTCVRAAGRRYQARQKAKATPAPED